MGAMLKYISFEHILILIAIALLLIAIFKTKFTLGQIGLAFYAIGIAIASTKILQGYNPELGVHINNIVYIFTFIICLLSVLLYGKMLAPVATKEIDDKIEKLEKEILRKERQNRKRAKKHGRKKK